MLRSRVSILLILTFLGFVLVVAKLYKIQIIDKDLFTKRAEAITRGRIRFEKERGTITDRRGRHLAVSLRVKSLAANPRKFPDLESKQIAANRLAPILNQDASEILRKLNRPKEFSWLARKMSDTQTKAVSALKIKGLFFKDEFKRHYPHATLASHILGFVGAEDRG
ncbi:MAG: hypothetical protein JKX97_05110, partial [Candidatus Lindowbacteria bacterium]|nr:hypothetical protein [Candidatus Lindowbacteria bacterium]